jgi:hypothetical protein
MHNYKFICLHCLRSQKGHGSCCGWPMFGIGYKARAPKKTAKKSEWKQFIQYFIFNSNDKGQLKRIIQLRKEYGLPTLKQETKLEKMQIVHEQKFGTLDIKHHEKLLEVESYSWSDHKDKDFVEYLDRIVGRYIKYKTVKDKDLEHNKEYFIVPIHALMNGTYIFPPTIDKYEIYKVRSKVEDRHRNIYNFRIKTNNINEMVDYSGFESGYEKNKFSSTQIYLLFHNKENAMAFRQEYLTHIIPFFKEKGVEFVGELVKKANIDFDRVMKKAPELLV